ncbi:acyl-CoA thioesterase II [Candidatus Palauibacter sp.]|uniref:acyl-CoA thioesterase II n=1 Tax=Candidatus Palauibacter sp. TaxID=3101350 RepID=UPI003B0118CA
MSYTVQDLIGLFDLEPIERNIYRGQNRDIGSGRIFGGQVLAQALVAARRTVDEEDRLAHSVHAYFILAGDLNIPVVYFVDRLRDGRSFTTRRVTAIQHGRAIFNLSASFHRREDGISHQATMPDVPPPEELEPELDNIRRHAQRIPPPLRAVLTQDRPIERRPVAPIDPFRPAPREPERHAWVRSVGGLGDEPLDHQAVLAYASDYGLLRAALLPHGRTFFDRDLMGASLDHAIWFHRPFRIDDWLLYETESTIATGARAFTRGSFYTRDGALVASVAQEGVIRTGGKPGTRGKPEARGEAAPEEGDGE